MGTAGSLDKDSVAAGTLQGVDLELRMLVGGGDSGVAEQMCHDTDHLTTLRHWRLCDVDFGHGFWISKSALVRVERGMSQKRPVADKLTVTPRDLLGWRLQ